MAAPRHTCQMVCHSLRTVSRSSTTSLFASQPMAYDNPSRFKLESMVATGIQREILPHDVNDENSEFLFRDFGVNGI